MRKYEWCLLAACILASCGSSDSSGGMGAGDRIDPFSPSSIPAQLRGGGTPIGDGRGLPEGLEDNAGVVLNPDELVWTDMDAESPDSIPELNELLSAAPEEGPWRHSHSNALKEARHSDKPVLVWFTDSQNSPNCKALNEELFNTREFDEWAETHFVRLQVDQRISGSRTDDSTSRKIGFVKDLKKHYRVHGQPTLLVLTPAGEVIGRYKGYRRGQADYKWGQLKQGEMLAGKAHQVWKKKMGKKGYRTWSDPRGRRIFAKLMLYRDGKLLLMEPDGTRFQTKMSNLSPADQDWVTEQKRISDLRHGREVD